MDTFAANFDPLATCLVPVRPVPRVPPGRLKMHQLGIHRFVIATTLQPAAGDIPAVS